MDSPHIPSSTPQIRSRITVVCAECKRLKLKCDRRTPCGSCTKRDTVMRCIYSPAAAEKVDLHSLNNRLIQVEGLLTLMTAGKTPPPFQSSYPLAQIPLSTSAVTHRQPQPRTGRPQITPGTALSMISVSMTDLDNIWLAHCNLDVDFGLRKQPQKVDPDSSESNYVKLEPSIMDSLHPIIIDDSLPATLPPLSIYHPPSNYTFPDHTTPYSFNTPMDIPITHHPQPQSISSPTSSASIPPSDTNSISPSPSNAHHPRSKPIPSPSLLALLAAPQTRTRFLHRARTAYPELGVFIPWDRVLDLSADSEEVKEREREREREKKTVLAKAVFFGVRGESSGFTSSQSHATMQGTAGDQGTLPLFVVLCYLLALGASAGTPTGVDAINDTFVRALAGQAMDVWESYRLSHEFDYGYTSHEHEHEQQNRPGDQYQNESKYEHGVEEDNQNSSAAEREAEDVDHVLACLMQVVYLVKGRAAAEKREAWKEVFPLIGKLVNLARNAKLARDPDITDGIADASGQGRLNAPLSVASGHPNGNVKDSWREKERDRRRMLWWEIMFYDTFVSDVLDQPATITLGSYSTRWPACVYPASSPSTSTPSPSSASSSRSSHPHPSQYRDVDADIDADAEDGMSQDDDQRHMKHTAAKTSKRDLGLKPRGKGRSKSSAGFKALQGGESVPEVVFGIRCRLTHLTQTIKHALQLANSASDPEAYAALGSGCQCEYRYTLDEAVRLEAEIRTWAADLPPFLQLDCLTDPGADLDPTSINSESRLFGVVSSASVSKSSISSMPGPHRSSPRSVSAAILAAELAILANRLIIAVYVPFLRASRSGGTGTGTGMQLHPAYVAHSWSPASRATVDAARGVVRAAMVMHRLMVGAGAAISAKAGTGSGVDGQMQGIGNGMVLSEFYPLDKALVDAVVVCTHAGVVNGGVKVQKGKGVMEDVGVGLEVLGAMGMERRGDLTLTRVVDALRRKVEGLGVTTGVAGLEERVEENLLKRKHDQVELGLNGSRDVMEDVVSTGDGIYCEYDNSQGYGNRSMEDTTAPQSPSRRQQLQHQGSFSTDVERDKDKDVEKEKKHAKKGHVGHPTVGYRVREGKGGPPWAAKNRRASRSPPSAAGEAFRGSTPLEKTLTMPVEQGMSYQGALPQPLMQEPTYHLKSSSMSQHPLDFSMTFAPPQQQHSPTTQTPTHVFTLSPSGYNHNADQQQTQSPRAGSFEVHRGFDPVLSSQESDSSAAYGPAGSPYTNSMGSGSMSNASSPYASNRHGNGNGTANTGPPTFSHTHTHRHTPAPAQTQDVGASPQAYFHLPHGYENNSGVVGGYESSQHQQQQGMMSIETTMEDPDASCAPRYDVKPSPSLLDQMPSHAHVQAQVLQYGDAQPNQMVPAAPGHTWNTAPRQLSLPQLQIRGAEHGGSAYWASNGVPVFY